MRGRKPYSTLPTRKAEGKQGWSNREANVALFSVVVSAIGVIFAAVSSFIAWQQVEMLSRERMTPYRAIVYNSRLESFKSVWREWGDFRYEWSTYPPELDDLPKGSAAYNKILTQRSAKMQRKAHDFKITLRANSVLWSPNVEELVDTARVAVTYSTACDRATVRYGRHPTPSETKVCDREARLENMEYLDARMEDVREKMWQELRGETLRNLP